MKTIIAAFPSRIMMTTESFPRTGIQRVAAGERQSIHPGRICMDRDGLPGRIGNRVVGLRDA